MLWSGFPFRHCSRRERRLHALYFSYSISALPQTGYKPRLADDLVGHFFEQVEDYSSDRAHQPTKRYINRWQLEKLDPIGGIVSSEATHRFLAGEAGQTYELKSLVANLPGNISSLSTNDGGFARAHLIKDAGQIALSVGVDN